MSKGCVQFLVYFNRKFLSPQLNHAVKFDCVAKRLMASQEMVTEGILSNQEESATSFNLRPIGYIKSCFKTKNGTPRQPSVCSFAKARLKILKSIFVRPDHSIEGLQEFSHVWLIFVFHKNNSGGFTKAKVKPPRLNGQKTGVFACRSPYRPNPIGLTLAKLESVEGDTLHLSGIDIINGTPVLDIKPFIPDYDSVLPPLTSVGLEGRKDIHELNHKDEVVKQSATNSTHVTKEMVIDENTSPPESSVSSDCLSACEFESSRNSCYPDISDLKLRECKAENTIVEMLGVNPKSDVSVGEWVSSPPVNKLKVRFTPNALEEIHRFKRHNHEGSETKFSLEFFKDGFELQVAIESIVSADPRSTYRRTACEDKLYYFPLDTVHVTCWFGDDFAEILRVQPLCDAAIPGKNVHKKIAA